MNLRRHVGTIVLFLLVALVPLAYASDDSTLPERSCGLRTLFGSYAKKAAELPRVGAAAAFRAVKALGTSCGE